MLPLPQTLPETKPPPRPPKAVRSRHRWSWQARLNRNAWWGPVLATCGIRPPDEVFKNTRLRLLLLADPEEEEYHRKQLYAHLLKGVMYTVQRILTCIKRSIGLCLQSLHRRFSAWTKPDTTSLLLLTLTDLARSKFELVAENVLLRKPLIIIRRQVKQPACTKPDRMLRVLLARAVRPFWKYTSRAAMSKPKIAALARGAEEGLCGSCCVFGTPPPAPELFQQSDWQNIWQVFVPLFSCLPP